MVNEAKRIPNITLANTPISAVERNRLSEEQVTPMKSIHNITEEQFPIALKRKSLVEAATSRSHTSGLTLEHATWRPQKPSVVKHDSGYSSHFADRERDHVSRDTDKGRARYISNAGGSSTSDITDRSFDRPKHSPFIELDDMPRSARSATDVLDRRSLLRTASLSNRPVPLESSLPSTPEEDSLMPYIFTISRQESTTSTNSDQAPSVFNIPSSTEPYNVTNSAKGRERNRILTPEQQWSAIYRARDRRQTTSRTYIEASASAPAFERLDEDYPPPPAPPHLVAPGNPRSVVPATMYSRSSGSPSSIVPMGYSYSSDSLSSTVPIGHSHFPSSSQLSPPSASRPITIKKLFSLEDDGFQSSPSPRDWDVPSRSPYETYEFSHSPQTPDELPRSWQSSSFRARHSSQDMRYGYRHVHQYDDDLDDSDLREYDERRLLQREESFRRREEVIYLWERELKRREDVILEAEAKQKEDKPRREEDEANRVEDKIVYRELEVVRQGDGEGTDREEDEIKWKEKIARKEEEKARRKEAQGKKRAEDLGRREESAAKRLEEERRRIFRKPEEAKCQKDEVKFKEQASPTKEEKIQRKEEELARREEELSRREAEANRRHDQQQAQQEEFRKRVKELRRQSVEEKTKQGWKSSGWGYHPTTPPPRISASRSFSFSTRPRSISNRDERMSTASPPANRGRSTSISTSRSNTTWTPSTRLSSTANSWRSDTPKPQTPSAQKNQPRQISPPNSNELHMSAAGSPITDRGRTCTSRSNATWTSSSRLSSNVSSHLPSTPNPQISLAYKNLPRQMSTSKSSSSSTGPWPIPGRNETPHTNSHRNRSTSTSTSHSNTPWTFSRLSSITRSQSSSTPKLQTPSPQKSLPPQISSRSASFSTIGQPIPKRNDLHIPATISSTHKNRSKSTSTGRSSSTWTYSTRLIPTVSSQPSIASKSQTPSAQQNKKVAPGNMEAGVLKEKDSKGDGINWKETFTRKEVQEIGKETQVRNMTDVVRPEEEKVKRHIAYNLWPRSDESRCKEEARLEEFGAVHITEEEVLKEGQPARGKECNKPTPHNSGNMPPCVQSLLNTSTSPSSETTTEEEADQESPGSASDSLEDLTNELQRRSRYPIAFGGFGDIWKCDLVKASGTIQVAVKTIRSFESDNEELMRKNAKRVRRELKVWGRLRHHSILPLCGVATDFGPHPAMICPWADNGALTGFLERQQDVLSSQDKFALLNDIALGLQYLHNESVVHGDLTGSNVLIYGNGRACLADFGLSTIILEFIGTSYFTSSIRGNVRWVAAELCEAPEDDEISLSSECDIYSFGSITLQVLTCKVPYYNVKNDIVVLGQVIKGKKPEPPKESQIASGHWEFIQRCWLPRASRPSVGEIVAFVGCEQQALLSRSTEI